MTNAQAEGIGRAVAGLLAWDAERPMHMGRPIEVEEGMALGDVMVTLYACEENGDDVEVRVGVGPAGGVHETALVRRFEGNGMGEWKGVPVSEVLR